jgi:hypothetical protein
MPAGTLLVLGWCTVPAARYGWAQPTFRIRHRSEAATPWAYRYPAEGMTEGNWLSCLAGTRGLLLRSHHNSDQPDGRQCQLGLTAQGVSARAPRSVRSTSRAEVAPAQSRPAMLRAEPALVRVQLGGRSVA